MLQQGSAYDVTSGQLDGASAHPVHTRTQEGTKAGKQLALLLSLARHKGATLTCAVAQLVPPSVSHLEKPIETSCRLVQGIGEGMEAAGKQVHSTPSAGLYYVAYAVCITQGR